MGRRNQRELFLQTHLGEEDDVPDSFGAGEDHDQTVDAHAHAAGGRHAVFQSVEEVFIHFIGQFVPFFPVLFKLVHQALTLDDGIVEFRVGRGDFHAVDAQFKDIHQTGIIRTPFGQGQQFDRQTHDESGLDVVGLDELFVQFIGDLQIGHLIIDIQFHGLTAGHTLLMGDIKPVLAALFFGFSYRAALSFSPACYIAGLACIIGHIKPIFYGFRGGKGVLSSATVILMLCPPVFLALIAIFVLIVWATRYISLGSIVSAAALPLLLQGYMQAFIFTGDPDAFFEGGIVLFGLAFALIVIICHRANIKRLWHHEENKFSFHRSTPKTEEDGDGK